MTAPESTPALALEPRAKTLLTRPEFRATWFGHAANDNAGPRCNCVEQADSPAPDACPRHDGDE